MTSKLLENNLVANEINGVSKFWDLMYEITGFIDWPAKEKKLLVLFKPFLSFGYLLMTVTINNLILLIT